MKLVSACLLGVKCRYDGRSCPNEKLLKLAGEGELLPICPEQLGGLGTPRERAWIVKGDGSDVLNGKARVTTESGKGVTRNFIRGAEEALKLAKLFRVEGAILKSKSPSCGIGMIYRDFSDELKQGDGVTASILKRNGIKVISEEELSKID